MNQEEYNKDSDFIIQFEDKKIVPKKLLNRLSNIRKNNKAALELHGEFARLNEIN